MRLATIAVLLVSLVLAAGQSVARQTSGRHPSPLVITQSGILVRSAKFQRVAPPVTGNAAPSLPSPFEDHAYLLKESVWTTNIIPVCWERLEDSAAADRLLVQHSIEQSWAASSRLMFVGWQACPADNFAGIRIAAHEDGPHTKQLGRFLAGIHDGMVLNFTFHVWSPSCQTQRTMCIRSIAVHEFGHALGFAHEQNRPDTPGECLQKPQGSNGNVMLTSWDPHSVMNYCNSRYNNLGLLSDLDKVALRQVYG